ncbi:MAG: TPM domain-containing protein [Filifactoraceae bacterium]
MKKFILSTSLVIVLSFLLVNPIIADETQSTWLRDYGNFISEDNRNKIENISDKVHNLTGINPYIVTVDENANMDLTSDLEELKNINSVMLIYSLPSGSIDIKTGKNSETMFTSEVINKIKGDSNINALLKSSDDKALVYLSTLVANTVLTSNNFKPINLDDKSNNLQNKLFYLGIILLMLIALFMTPLSPYKKLKKLKKGESPYAPHSTNGEMFYGGIESDKRD